MGKSVEAAMNTQATDEKKLICSFCKLRAGSKEKLRTHMTNRHAVLGSKLSEFISAEMGSDSNENGLENKNKCKICDVVHDNLGKLWNHYKRTHRVMKDAIKSLISKSKCTICEASVTFIGDHYRNFH